jgi:hypothetical protein
MRWFRKHSVNLAREYAPVEIETHGERDPAEFDDLVSQHGYAIYERMLADAHVKACFNLKRWGVLSVPWRLEPADASPDAQRAHEFIQYTLHTMQGGVFGLLWRVLDALAKGCAILEKLYAYRAEPPYAGFWTLVGFKAKNPALFRFEVDAYRNVRALILHAPTAGNSPSRARSSSCTLTTRATSRPQANPTCAPPTAHGAAKSASCSSGTCFCRSTPRRR